MVCLHKNRFPVNTYSDFKSKKIDDFQVLKKNGYNIDQIDLPTDMNTFKNYIFDIFEDFPSVFLHKQKNMRTSFLQEE